MKKFILIIILIASGVLAYYFYIDTNSPVINWNVEHGAYINKGLTINIADDQGLSEICYSLSGAGCSAEERCLRDFTSASFDLAVDPENCVTNNEPFKMKINVAATDTSLLPNQTVGSIELTYDNQPPSLVTLRGTRYLKQGGSGVVLYEVGEDPNDTGIVLGDLLFRSFRFSQNKYLSLYAHPYNVAADEFKPRIFAVDNAGNLRKIRPGSTTASHSYKSEVIKLTDDFLETVKNKIMANSQKTPLNVFKEINDTVRQQNNQTIVELCQTSENRKLWDGVFLRNQGATRANFAENRTYVYNSSIVSQQVHTGIDIAGVSKTPIVAANHGKVVFTGAIGIYGNVVVLDHGYGLHSLYGHLSQINVQVGDRVEKGEVMATSGESGLAFGDHLHFEIRVNGVPVNPIEWIDRSWVKNKIEVFLPNNADTE
ncbi:MAG: M23 family metallopeptidase [Deltaproteobacteria bacterium]|nr:M23 family metallopeptidase [Deltaproteobacteria bacterium]